MQFNHPVLLLFSSTVAIYKRDCQFLCLRFMMSEISSVVSWYQIQCLQLGPGIRDVTFEKTLCFVFAETISVPKKKNFWTRFTLYPWQSCNIFCYSEAFSNRAFHPGCDRQYRWWITFSMSSITFWKIVMRRNTALAAPTAWIKWPSTNIFGERSIVTTVR